jgi:predicted flap endonuclease-1-like 5' DNA nuclease
MSYLINQIFWCLLLAFLLGFLLGWLLRHFACKSAMAELEKRIAESRPAPKIPAFHIEEIEGIGKGFGRRLREIGIKDTAQLLTGSLTEEDRNKISQAVDGLDDQTIRAWATMADLLRIPGIGGQWAELLWRCDVASVQSLARQRTPELLARMAEVNDREHRVQELPGERRVEHWIAEAKLAPAILPERWE